MTFFSKITKLDKNPTKFDKGVEHRKRINYNTIKDIMCKDGIKYMKSLSESIADFYIKKNIIDPAQKAIYVYGISLLINDVVDCCIILIPAVITGHAMYGIVFLSVFWLLRVHCGGLHAKKVWICALIMLLTFCAVCIITYITSEYYNVTWSIIIFVVSALTMLPIIPVENPNKMLSPRMRRKSKCMGITIMILFAGLSVVLSAYGIRVGMVISYTVLSVAILAIIGKIYNRKGGVQSGENT